MKDKKKKKKREMNRKKKKKEKVKNNSCHGNDGRVYNTDNKSTRYSLNAPI